MNDKLNFLQRYNKDVRIIEGNDMVNYLPFIPDTWSNIFKESNMEDRIRKTWKFCRDNGMYENIGDRCECK